MSEKPQPAASESQPLPGSATASATQPLPGSAAAAVPIGAAVSNDSNLLNLVHSGSRILIGFNYREMPDETRVDRFRVQLLDFVHRTKCKSLTFDLKGLKILPSRMLGFFVSLKNDGHDVELINMELGVQDIFRVTKLGPLFTIHPVSQ